MKLLTQEDKIKLSDEFKVPILSIDKVLKVESGGKGFDETTGKIIIQFEPSWFKKQSPYTPSGLWSLNKVERQAGEWTAFNNAYQQDPDSAMESTSIGLMQVLGLHFKKLGFEDVGKMWDYAKESEYNQLRLGILFIKNNKYMFNAFKDLTDMSNCRTFAYYYNGGQYEKYKYHTKLFNA